MKKTNTLTAILLLLSLLFAAFAVNSFADNSSVGNREIYFYFDIKGTVSNKNGSVLYSYKDNTPEDEYYDINYVSFEQNSDDVVPFDSKIIINGKYTIDSTDYYACSFENDDRTTVYLLAADVTPDLTPVKPTDIKNSRKLDSPRKYYAVNPEGSFLYEGPAEIYGKASKKLPANTEITGEYYVGLNEISKMDNAIGIWVYATYNNESGWAHVSVNPTDHPDFVRKAADSEYFGENERDRLYFIKETPIFRDIYSAGDYYFFKEYNNIEKTELLNNVIGTVPKNTSLKFDYYSFWEGDLTVRVNYNGTVGWVNVGQPHMSYYSETSVESDSIYVITDFYNSMETYSEPDSVTGKTGTQIPPHSVLTCDYFYASEEDWGTEPDFIYTPTIWCRVNYHGENLWITSDNNSITQIYGMSQYKVVDPDRIVIYSSPDESSETADKVAAGDIIFLSNTDNEWNIIRFGDNQYGWIKKIESDNLSDIVEYIFNDDDDYDSTDFKLPLDLLNENSPDYQEPVPEAATEKPSFDLIVIICAAAIILIIIAVAAIAITKKKKK